MKGIAMLIHVICFPYTKTRKPLCSVRLIAEDGSAHEFVIPKADVTNFVETVTHTLRSDNIFECGYRDKNYSLWESFDGNIVLASPTYSIRITYADLEMIISELKYNGN